MIGPYVAKGERPKGSYWWLRSAGCAPVCHGAETGAKELKRNKGQQVTGWTVRLRNLAFVWTTDTRPAIHWSHDLSLLLRIMYGVVQ